MNRPLHAIIGRTIIGRRRAIAAAGCLLASPAVLRAPVARAQGQAGGVALVIGNSNYRWEAPLPNVRRDAPDVAERFRALGLKTELVQDAGRDAMNRAIDSFRSASRGANLAAFYFAGHGASWGKETYLVPMDTDLGNPGAVQGLIPVPAVSAAMKGAAHRLVVFDNCRNNPADGWRQLEAEREASLTRETQRGADGTPNTLVLYSTAPGRVALDGPAGENSPFAATLLRQLKGESIDLQALPARLRRELLIATGARQVVWDQNTYRQPFLLSGPPGRPPGAAGNKSAGKSGDKSGWSRDASGIIELTNAYAFAQQSGLLLPSGLVAHRSPGKSRDSRKVGSFKFLAQTMNSPAPRILIVLSLEDQQTAQIIQAGSGRTGPVWRFVSATLSGDNLDYVTRDRGEHFTFTWTDANAGHLTQNPDGADSQRQYPFNTGFTRLDG